MRELSSRSWPGLCSKYKSQYVLLRQAYIRDENLTVAELVNQAVAQLGENIVIRRFIRWEICPDGEDE